MIMGRRHPLTWRTRQRYKERDQTEGRRGHSQWMPIWSGGKCGLSLSFCPIRGCRGGLHLCVAAGRQFVAMESAR